MDRQIRDQRPILSPMCLPDLSYVWFWSYTKEHFRNPRSERLQSSTLDEADSIKSEFIRCEGRKVIEGG